MKTSHCLHKQTIFRLSVITAKVKQIVNYIDKLFVNFLEDTSENKLYLKELNLLDRRESSRTFDWKF